MPINKSKLFHYFLLIDQESLNKENKVRTIRLTAAYIIPHFGRYRLETTVEAIIIKRPDIVKSFIDNFIPKFRLRLHQMGYI